MDWSPDGNAPVWGPGSGKGSVTGWEHTSKFNKKPIHQRRPIRKQMISEIKAKHMGFVNIRDVNEKSTKNQFINGDLSENDDF